METSYGDCRCSFLTKNIFSKKDFLVFLFRGVMKHRVEIIVKVFVRKKKKKNVMQKRHCQKSDLNQR